MTLAEIKAAIKARYAGEGYALAFEVRNQTGYGSNIVRYADAMCLGLWSSHGYYLQGFEFKVSRSDVLAELTNPEKAREIQKYCHYWWLVVGDAKLVSVDELPATWGLMVPRGAGLAIKKAAPLMQPDPLSYPMVGALIRANVKEANSDAAIAARVSAAVADASANSGARIQRLTDRVEDLEKMVAEFERVSGVKITRWHAGQIGEAVKMICAGGLTKAAGRFEGMELEIERLLLNFRSVREEAQRLAAEPLSADFEEAV